MTFTPAAAPSRRLVRLADSIPGSQLERALELLPGLRARLSWNRKAGRSPGLLKPVENSSSFWIHEAKVFWYLPALSGRRQDLQKIIRVNTYRYCAS